MILSQIFLLKDTSTLPISNDKIEFVTDKWSFIAHISHFNTSDSDEMAWQIRDILEKNFEEKITDFSAVKRLAFDFCSRLPIANEILSDLDGEK